MPKKTPEQQVEELLKKMPSNLQGGPVANNPDLANAIAHFMKLKAAGDPSAHVTLDWFYTHALRDQFSGPKSITTVKTYVREFLKLNFQTGNPLNS